jgi:hypothetical protein
VLLKGIRIVTIVVTILIINDLMVNEEKKYEARETNDIHLLVFFLMKLDRE